MPREGFVSVNDERKALIMDLLRKSVTPLTREEITAALGWPESILIYNGRKWNLDPLRLLIEEGKIEKKQIGNRIRYRPDPDISKMIGR